MKQEVSLSIPCQDAHLEGILNLPENTRGLVLFVHGSGSSRFSSRNQFVAEVLNTARLGTLLFDLLTAEEDAIDTRTREFRFNIPLLADRLLDVIAWCRQDPRVHDLPLGLFGASTGAAAALIAAAKDPKQVKAVVSRGGRPDLAEEYLLQVRAPTLLIVGENDHEVIILNQNAYAQMPCFKEIAIVPGATHLFEEAGSLDEVARLAKSWFFQYLSNLS